MNICEICDSLDWSLIYSGSIRDGSFGKETNGEVFSCNKCKVVRLNESACISSKAYDTKEYRTNLGQGKLAEDFFIHGDPIQIHNLSAFWPMDIRNKLVADIGTGGGSFSDHIAKIAKKIVAIEPTEMYHESLKKRGYQVFNYTTDALKIYRNSLDIVFSFQVIEHVLNPKQFLLEAMELLKPGGRLIIATPNHNDILMKLIPEYFHPFYYRTQHRWYFDSESLSYCFNNALNNKAELISIKYLHTFGFANTLIWLRDKVPKGNQLLDGINSVSDKLWSSYLESTGQTDTIYLLAKKGE